MDAKIATADMANHMMVWAEIGRPNESVAARRQVRTTVFSPAATICSSAEPSKEFAAAVATSEQIAFAKGKQQDGSPQN